MASRARSVRGNEQYDPEYRSSLDVDTVRKVRNGRNLSSTETFDVAEGEIVAFRCTGQASCRDPLASFVVLRPGPEPFALEAASHRGRCWCSSR